MQMSIEKTQVSYEKQNRNKYRNETVQKAAGNERMQTVADVPCLFGSIKPPNEKTSLTKWIGVSTPQWIFRMFPYVHGENSYV
jgi:hypothetical protein